MTTETQADRQILKDIEARHKDILSLENSVRELHDMFTDMTTLVESQVVKWWRRSNDSCFRFLFLYS